MEKLAYVKWLRMYPLLKWVDEQVDAFLSEKIVAYAPKKMSWLKTARTGLLLPSTTLAEKLSITRAAYTNLEKREFDGTISLATLARAAEAMNCELVYGIRHKKRLRFSQVIWATLHEASQEHWWAQARPMRPKTRLPDALAAVAKWSMEDPKFRQEQGWSERRHNSALKP